MNKEEFCLRWASALESINYKDKKHIQYLRSFVKQKTLGDFS